MRIDAHQHYWKISRGDYGWITPEVPVLYRDFLEEDLAPFLKKCDIDKTIVVQAAPTAEETNFLLSLSDQTDSIIGVVGWIDLENPAYKEQLEMLRKHPKFVGIRIMIQDMEDENVILEPDFSKALSHLGELDIPVDLLVLSSQLTAVCEMLNKVRLRGVIDHLAKPEIAQGKLEPWKKHMEEIASHPTIYCKLSGMVTEANHHNWKKEEFIPYVHHIMHCFGMDRVMYGSDWPVCLLSGSYEEVYNLLHQTLPEDISKEEKARLYGGNALEFYKLGR
ncbi:amidohydrolase family protein [Sediminibacillus massiliensis]|uniref:amidohydrolase family protein n=1 Tax=Sediminibacillus massiliensis TaxID=1926277 RepID=UPI0015C33A9E|nr:amidohydrolase family protein [Sediminibacillus massiliensis]